MNNNRIMQDRFSKEFRICWKDTKTKESGCGGWYTLLIYNPQEYLEAAKLVGKPEWEYWIEFR